MGGHTSQQASATQSSLWNPILSGFKPASSARNNLTLRKRPRAQQSGATGTGATSGAPSGSPLAIRYAGLSGTGTLLGG